MTTNRTEYGNKNGLTGHRESKQSGSRDDFDAVKEDLGEFGSAGVHEAHRLAELARTQAQHFATRQKHSAANTIEEVSRMLREATSGLEDKANIQRVVSYAAATLEDVSSAVRDKTFTALYEDAESFARRRPLATALGTAALGLVIARFIKSSSEKAGYARGYSHARADLTGDELEGMRPSRYR